MRRLFLAALAAASLAIVSDAYSQAQQNFTLINRSGQQIDEVYVSATSQNQWGRDILGDGVMPSGTRRNITFPQRTRACRFDLKVVFRGGEPAEARNLDLCSISNVTVGGGGRSASIKDTAPGDPGVGSPGLIPGCTFKGFGRRFQAEQQRQEETNVADRGLMDRDRQNDEAADVEAVQLVLSKQDIGEPEDEIASAQDRREGEALLISIIPHRSPGDEDGSEEHGNQCQDTNHTATHTSGDELVVEVVIGGTS